jgi:hypothetical protein
VLAFGTPAIDAMDGRDHSATITGRGVGRPVRQAGRPRPDRRLAAASEHPDRDVEDHTVVGGFGSAVLEVRCRNWGSTPRGVTRLGLPDVDSPGVDHPGQPVSIRAHQLSTGMIVTPIAAHSLAFRPLALAAATTLDLDLVRANDTERPGTALVADGRVSTPVATGDRVRVTATGRTAVFVRNPRSSYWTTLVDKMGWGASPVKE